MLPKLQRFFLFDETFGKTRTLGSKIRRAVPRFVIVDSTDDLHQELHDAFNRTGPDKLYDDDTYIAFQGDGAGNCMGRGYKIYKSGKFVQGKIFEKIHAVTGGPEHASALIVIHSLGGGTGSGVGSALLEDLRTRYKDLLRVLISVAVIPHPKDDQVGEPYLSLNTTLALHSMLKCSDIVILYDNRAITRIIEEINRIKGSSEEQERPLQKILRRKEQPWEFDSFSPINRMIARSLACLTNLYLFPSTPAQDMMNVKTNLDVGPDQNDESNTAFNLVVPSLSPLGIEGGEYREEHELVSLASECFDRSHLLVDLTADKEYSAKGHVGHVDHAVFLVASKRSQVLSGFKPKLKDIVEQRFHVDSFPEPFQYAQIYAPFNQIGAYMKARNVFARLDYHAKMALDALESKRSVLWHYRSEYLTVDEIRKRIEYVAKKLKQFAARD